jgi:hypothetical protein
MEFVSGTLLSEEIERKGALQQERAEQIITQDLRAVSNAHRNGIIHRDLKPDNIMITEEAGSLSVKVLDFGIARLVGGESLTMTGEGFGTPSYMSPERISGGQGIDHRTDIYSLGIILFEMLTGKPPFESVATDPAIFWSEIRRLHESEPLPSLAGFGVTPALDDVIRKAAAKRVEARFATADEMLTAIAGGAPGARLLVTTQPPSAEILIDNLPRGRSNESTGKLLVDGLTPGVHSVRVEKAGYQPYKIDVILDPAHESALQVSLPARVTVAIPAAYQTSPAASDPDDVKTAVFVFDQLQPGSTVMVGARTAGRADANGRATLMLAPGSHDVAVASLSGETRGSIITVADNDVGTTKLMTLPMRSGTVAAGSSGVTRPLRRFPKGRLAAAAAILLLLGLGVFAYLVLKGPDPRLTAGADQGASGEANASNPDPDPIDQNGLSVSQNANVASVRNENPSIAANANRPPNSPANSNAVAEPPAKPDTTIDARPTSDPARPEPPGPRPEAEACVTVVVMDRENRPVPAARVGITESGTQVFRFNRTGPNGRALFCGMSVGTRVKVALMGMGTRRLAVGETTVAAGGSSVILRRDPEAESLRPRDRLQLPPRRPPQSNRRP